MKIETVFKVGDRIYEGIRFQDWGIVKEISNSTGHPIIVLFDSGDRGSFTSDGRYRLNDRRTLSFTEYDLVKGGFSQERPEILPEKGDIVWVKDNQDDEWRITYFVRKVKRNILFPYECSNYIDLTNVDCYKFMTTENPYNND